MGEPDTICHKCSDNIDVNNCFIQCSECSCAYHLGACCGLSEATYKSKGEEYRRSWRCPDCRKPKSSATSSNETEGLPIAALLLEINRKLDELLPLKQTVNDIEASIKHVSEQYDKVVADVTKNSNEIKNMKTRLSKLEETKADVELQRVTEAINELEYHSRKLNVEIHGLPVKNDECLMTTMNEIASKLNLPLLTEQSVTGLHRLPSKPDKVPGVIIRFSCLSAKERWFAKRKDLPTAQPGLFMMENLTAYNRTLLKNAKDWALDNQFSYAWHRNGKVFVKKCEGARRHLIKRVSDLDRLK